MKEKNKLSSISVLTCILPVAIHKDERRDIIQNELKNTISKFHELDIISYDIIFDTQTNSYVTEFNLYVKQYNFENLEKIVNSINNDKFPKNSYIKDNFNQYTFGNLEGIKISLDKNKLDSNGIIYKTVKHNLMENIDNLKYYGHFLEEKEIILYFFVKNQNEKIKEIENFFEKEESILKYKIEKM